MKPFREGWMMSTLPFTDIAHYMVRHEAGLAFPLCPALGRMVCNIAEADDRIAFCGRCWLTYQRMPQGGFYGQTELLARADCSASGRDGFELDAGEVVETDALDDPALA